MRSFGLQLSSFHLALSYWNILQSLTFQLMHILFMPSLWSFFLCFLIILVSYSSIVIQISFGKQPHCHCAKNRERNLTKTIHCDRFIFTANDAIEYFPNLLWSSSTYSKNHFASKNLSVIFSSFDFFLFHANSLINPNIRISGFKRAFFFIFVSHIADAACSCFLAYREVKLIRLEELSLHFQNLIIQELLFQ